ncbi:MAG: hypothetical protein LKG11_01210 [Bacilli bacterium]|jgi:hypothetical protein|nr:hypothetical protein [Bacilli bacterium]
MKQSLISLENLTAANRKNAWLIAFEAFLIAALGAATALIYVCQTRATQTIFIWVGSIIYILILTIFFYVLFMMIRPLGSYRRFMRRALSKPRPLNDVSVLSLSEERETYKGFPCFSLRVKELDEGTIWNVRYESSAPIDAKIGGIYEIETYDEVLCAIKEEKRP